MRVGVIGAGVVGLACATELSERGAEVTLYERHAELGGNASWLAGGMLAPFCEGESAPESVVLRGAEAVNWWAKHVPGLAREGSLVVAPPRDSADIDRFAARTRGWERVDEARIGALEPDLAGRFRKGLFYAGEGHVDPRLAMAALRDGLIRRGVELRFGEEFADVAGVAAVAGVADPGRRDPSVAGVADPGGRDPSVAGVADPGGRDQRSRLHRIVDCRGFAARADLPDLRPVRGEMMRVRTREVTLRRPVRLLHPRIPLYICPRADGVFMIGATMIDSADPGGMSVRSAIELLSAAYALHPAFGEAEILEMSADLRPSYPDNEPRIVERDGRIHVNGFYRHGYLLAPHFAQRVAGMVMGL